MLMLILMPIVSMSMSMSMLLLLLLKQRRYVTLIYIEDDLSLRSIILYPTLMPCCAVPIVERGGSLFRRWQLINDSLSFLSSTMMMNDNDDIWLYRTVPYRTVPTTLFILSPHDMILWCYCCCCCWWCVIHVSSVLPPPLLLILMYRCRCCDLYIPYSLLYDRIGVWRWCHWWWWWWLLVMIVSVILLMHWVTVMVMLVI